VPLEVIAALTALAIPLPELLPVAVPLLVAGSASRWARGRSWGELARGGGGARAVLVGAIVGAAALAGAVALGTPLIEGLVGGTVQWSAYPLVRGNLAMLALVAGYVAVHAAALELALRGWIVERVLELSPGPPHLPILVGCLAEALATPGDLAARLGGAGLGAGLGCLYVACGRNVLAPLAARAVFQLGAVGLEALRILS
jgi:hypothetical protein